MKQNKQLASYVAAVFAVATLAGSSAFAESRHSNGTSNRGSSRGNISRGSGSGSAERGRSTATRDASRNGSRERSVARENRENRGDSGRIGRSAERGVTERQRESATADRNRDGNRDRDRSTTGYQRWEDRDGIEENRRGATYRDRSTDRRGANERWDDNTRNRNRGGVYGSRTPYWGHGRISNFHRYNGGYRVWIVGSPYPFFIADRYWNRDRFRIGLSIRLGGYYNPDYGYYDYYDGGYYDRGAHSTGELRGYVESVDYRRDTFVIRNEYTGSFVTVVIRDRRSDVRPGDYVEIYGDWSRSGIFNARDVDFIDRR